MIGREWSIEIDGKPFIENQKGSRQFRITFDVQVSPDSALSLADVVIYNLNHEMLAIKRRASIVLRAGFTDAADVIFIGYVTNVLAERSGTEIATRLVCVSGEPVTDRGSANGAYGKGTSIVDILRDLARSWPLQLDIDPAQFSDAVVATSGYVTSGDIPAALDALAYAYKFDWLQERGRLVISRKGYPRNISSVQVNQFTGMIGIPEVTHGPEGLGVFTVVRLNPFLRSNGGITITSRFSTFNTGNLYFQELQDEARANGEYYIFQLRHRGDSHGDLWVTEIDALRAAVLKPKEERPIEPTAANGTLVWGKRVDQDFRVKVREVGENLRIDPNWLMAVMGFETGYTFSPSVRNPGSSATGLIQFIDSTARGLGTTTTALGRMSAVQQLEYVQRYFEPYARRLNNMGDCYMAVLNPIAIGKPDSYVMWESTGPTSEKYAANSGLDVDRNGKITRGEAVTQVNGSYMRGLQYVA